jgi:hypothetical protein
MYRATTTRGVYNFCEEHNCYWFLDVINSYQTANFRQKNDFQVWKLQLNNKGNGAKVICEDGNENVILTQHIPFTDYKGEVLIFWFENNTIYLPEEH